MNVSAIERQSLRGEGCATLVARKWNSLFYITSRKWTGTHAQSSVSRRFVRPRGIIRIVGASPWALQLHMRKNKKAA